MFSIVIPVKNQFKIVRACLDSVAKYYLSSEVLLVDDSSTEATTIDLLKDYSAKYNWKLFRNEQSVGHSGACTKGIEESSNENVFLLNSDTIVTSKGLQILSDVLDKNSDIAVVGPSTTSASGPQMIKELYNKRFSMTEEDIEIFAKSIENDTRIVDLPLICGFAFGIKKSIFNRVGKFDENLTCYGNEKELLLKIRALGYRTVWVCASFILHLGKMSYANSGINISRAQLDADIYIMKKHGRLE
jgi:O-antigen biosynthesis protein